MLSKYDKVPAVNYVLDSPQIAHGHDGQIFKVNSHNQRKRNDSNFNKDKKDKKICPGCFYLGSRTKANINFKHFPSACPRSTNLVAMIEAEEAEDDSAGKNIIGVTSAQYSFQQGPMLIPKQNIRKINAECLLQATGPTCDILNNKSIIDALVLRLSYNMPRAPSPTMSVLLNNHSSCAVIDEGSELNCIDSNFAKTCRIEIIGSEQNAKSAGNHKMHVYGQTKDDVFIQVVTAKDKATLNLGVCLVVDNLGVNILIGQPAKIRHKIVTKPHLSLITFSDLEGKN